MFRFFARGMESIILKVKFFLLILECLHTLKLIRTNI